jgi:palmitoyl-protein thioesterase
MLVMFTEDSVVFPKESEWFMQLQADDMVTAQPIDQSAFWQEDYIGLRALDEAGKVDWISIVGDHLEFSQSDIDNTFIPFLLQ